MSRQVWNLRTVRRSGHLRLRLPTWRYPSLVAAVLYLIAAAISTAGCSRSPAQDYAPQTGPAPRRLSIEYSFGVLPLHNAVKLFETYEPLIDEINHHVSGFTVKLETANDYQLYEAKARGRKLQFAMMSSHVVIPAEDEGYDIIARTAERVRGVVLIRKDLRLRSVRDLKGRSITFASATDLSGTMMPKLFLKQNGLRLGRDATAKYVVSPESAIENVLLGRSAAACVSASAWQAFRTAQPGPAEGLEVRWQTDPLMGTGILARDDISPQDVRAVREALFGLSQTPRGQQVLGRLGISGFVPANAATYDPMWEFLNDYRRNFGYSPVLGGAE